MKRTKGFCKASPEQKWQHAHRLFQCLVQLLPLFGHFELKNLNSQGFEIFDIELGSSVALHPVPVEDW